MGVVNITWQEKPAGLYGSWLHGSWGDWKAWITQVGPEVVSGILTNAEIGFYTSMGGSSVERLQSYMAERIAAILAQADAEEKKVGQRCETCRFWEVFPGNGRKGGCWRHAPTLCRDGAIRVPVTKCSSSCGDWEAKV